MEALKTILILAVFVVIALAIIKPDLLKSLVAKIKNRGQPPAPPPPVPDPVVPRPTYVAPPPPTSSTLPPGATPDPWPAVSTVNGPMPGQPYSDWWGKLPVNLRAYIPEATLARYRDGLVEQFQNNSVARPTYGGGETVPLGTDFDMNDGFVWFTAPAGNVELSVSPRSAKADYVHVDLRDSNGVAAAILKGLGGYVDARFPGPEFPRLKVGERYRLQLLHQMSEGSTAKGGSTVQLLVQ